MKFSNIIIAMFLFTGILLGIGGFYSDMTSTYSVNNTTDARSSALMMQNELNTTTSGMYSQMNSTDGGLNGGANLWTIFGLILKAPVYIAKAFMSTGGSIISAMNTFSTTLGMPSWMLGLITTAIFFAIIVAVIRMTLNKEI